MMKIAKYILLRLLCFGVDGKGHNYCYHHSFCKDKELWDLVSMEEVKVLDFENEYEFISTHKVTCSNCSIEYTATRSQAKIGGGLFGNLYGRTKEQAIEYAKSINSNS